MANPKLVAGTPRGLGLVVCAVSIVSCVACSASDSSSPERSSGSPPTIRNPAAGAAPSGSAADNPTAGWNSGNPTGVVPITPAAAGSAAPQRPQMTPNTALTREPISIDDCGPNNAAGVSPADAQKLKAGAPPGMARWLYPYEGTVFPRGMLAPELMWEGPPGDAVYVHIKSKIFEYWACLKPMQPNRLSLPQEVWDKAGQRSFGKDDLYTIELSVLTGGNVVGLAQLHIQIAQAAIKGSIYYNTYRSNLLTGAAAGGADPAAAPGGFGIPPGLGGFPGGGGALGGIVVRIPASGRAEVFGQTDCNGCHSVSADGSLLLAQSVLNGAYSYQLVANGPAPMPAMAGASGCWVGLYPDGSAALAMSSVIDVARAGIFGGLAGTGSSDAMLFDTKTGQKLMSTGIPPGVLMPFFSPDGTYLTFNDYAADEAHGVALMHYDTKLHAATDYQVIYKEPAGVIRPAWPFVLPDNGAVLFVRTDDADFTGGGVGVQGDVQPGAPAPFSELTIVDLKSKSVTLLARAMGFAKPEDAQSNLTYLPFGMEDLHHAYYPTVSPVGAGGYFWVFFDSVRHYGGLGMQRQLWGAAIDISADGTYSRDPSYPAFYVSGQEFGTGNHRAFAALDPCRKDGDKCTSGIDCCGGFCYVEQAAELTDPVGMCSPKKLECAKRDERCLSAEDCCAPPDGEPPYSCIAGFCTYVRGPE